jgi:transcriptional regulator with XRE-family HTH domain
MTIPNGIGGALRTARTSRGMSLSDVASVAGISIATLSRIETGKQDVDVTLLQTLSRILHVAATHFFDGDGDGRLSAAALIQELALLSSAERAQVIAAATKLARRTGSREAHESRVENLLFGLDLIEDELRALQRDVKKR